MGAIKEFYHDEIEKELRAETNVHKIQWLNLPGYKGETWNPIAGCTKISEGCENCYAEKMAVRLAAMAIKHVKPMSVGKYVKVIQGRKWDGNTFMNEEELLIPLSWKQPRVVFVCSMGDLFHENTPFEWVDRVMAIAAVLPSHIFIVLTKRAKRMAEYFGQGKENLVKRWEDATYELGIADKNEDPDAAACFLYNRCLSGAKVPSWGWPLSNVWVGVTAENQERANERVPWLLQVPAAVKFVSVEPMLGPVDFEKVEITKVLGNNAFGLISFSKINHLDWVICGGESGHKARPLHPDWVRGLRDQCGQAGVPFFFKQWGEWIPLDQYNGDERRTVKQENIISMSSYGDYGPFLKTDYMIDERNYKTICKIGRKAAGNELDGRRWEEYPKGV